MTGEAALALEPGDIIMWRSGPSEMPFLGVVASHPYRPSSMSESVHIRVLWSPYGVQSNTWGPAWLERLA